MKKRGFANKFTANSTEYKAVCHTTNCHWEGVWRDNYSDAFDDGENHRNDNNGNNQFHDIKIIER